MFDVILGVSNAGKSTYIAELAAREPRRPVVMGFEIGTDTRLSDEIVHYNLLRPFDNRADRAHLPLIGDPALVPILDGLMRCRLTMLVCRPSTLIRRCLLRTTIEPILRGTDSAYPRDTVFEFLCRVPPAEVYGRWIDFFEHEHGASIDYVTSDDKAFRRISRSEAVAILSDPSPASYSAEERADILSKFSFPYQGEDGITRRESLVRIQPYLQGERALDVGCAEGFFSFEMEKVGMRVVGTDIKIDRFLAANAKRVVTGSKVDFRFTDAIPTGEHFDTILCLNVLHHLPDPIGTIRRISEACVGVAIIEFATPSDPLFRSTFSQSPPLNGAPVIGVSSLLGRDQTFLFSPEAIRRICLDHATLFKSVEFLQSPIPERMIAVCRK